MRVDEKLAMEILNPETSMDAVGMIYKTFGDKEAYEYIQEAGYIGYKAIMKLITLEKMMGVECIL